MKFKLFDLDLKGMSNPQLADWLYACRNEVKRENFDSDVQYYSALTVFCNAWEQHYKKNIEFYESTKFDFLLVYMTLKDNTTLITKYKGGEQKYPIGTCKDLDNITIDKTNTILEISSLMEDMFYEMKKIFDDEAITNYKVVLHNYLVKYRFSEIKLNRYIKGEYFNKHPVTSYNELEILSQQYKHYIYLNKTFKKTNYTNGLEQYDITKSVYSYFLSYDKCEKDFTKKMFINLGFLLGLSLEYLEKLLEYNGYSISENSQKKFDQIIRRAFKCGFSREMTIGLIDFEKAKGYNVPNLTKNKNVKGRIDA